MSDPFCLPCPPSLVRPRRAAFSAFRTGSLARLVLRSSRHAPSGVALVASFASPSRAAAFARRWSRRLGVSVRLRRGPGARWFEVSLPVFLGSSHWPPVDVVSPRGGWRPFRRSVLAAGWF